MEGDSSQATLGPSNPCFDFGAVDEGALWLGGNDNLESGWSSIGSLESGGALLSSGSWTISTEPGEEGLRWNGIKTEIFCGGSGGTLKQSAIPPPTPGLPAAPKPTKSISTLLPGVVKPDPEDAWEASVRDVTGSTGVFGDAAVLGTSNTDWPIPASSSTSPKKLSSPVTKNKGALLSASSAESSAPQLTKAVESTAVVAAPAAGKMSRPAAVTPAAALLAKAEPVEEPEDDEMQEPEEDEDEDFVKKEDDDELDLGTDLNDKRRRNREHAKRSRMRKRVRLGGLEGMLLSLRRENVRLRHIIKQSIPERADGIIRTCARDNTNADLVAKQDVVQGMRPALSINSSSRWSSRGNEGGGSRSRVKLEGGARHRSAGGRGKDHCVPSALKLMSPSYQSVKALSESQANFILTNPNLPDCPIIFASQGFFDLTGYKPSEVIGKNCRFLQGPGTDKLTVSILRNNLANGRDTSMCILNYKADGTPFWNQLSIGVLLDAQGQVANHVGVLCEVKQMPPAVFHKLLHRVPLPESLLKDDSSESGEDIADDMKPPKYGARVGRSSGSDSSRVVDRLRRTRAARASTVI